MADFDEASASPEELERYTIAKARFERRTEDMALKRQLYEEGNFDV